LAADGVEESVRWPVEVKSGSWRPIRCVQDGQKRRS
jgi:hypothetical protein